MDYLTLNAGGPDDYTHPRPGMRSHWPVMPAMRLLWMIITPLGLPVEPLVYITTARSDGWGLTNGLLTGGGQGVGRGDVCNRQTDS